MKSAFEKAHKARFGFIDRGKQLVIEAVSVEAVGGGAKFRERARQDHARQAALAARRTQFFSGGTMAQGRGLYPRPARTRREGARPRHRHRAAPDRRGRGRLARRDHREEPSGAGAHRHAQARRARSAPRPIRSCSRCSTTCSCRSPSRWACRCRTPPIRSTSRSGSTSPARSSRPTRRWSPTHRTCRCISARWTARSRPSSARTTARSGRATSISSTRPTTAARTSPTSPSARRCSTTRKRKILFWVASRGHHADIGGIAPGSMSPIATSIEEEGIYIDNFKLVDRGKFREEALYDLLTKAQVSGAQPAAERQRPEGADRRQREGRAGAAQDGGAVRPAGRARLHGPRAGQRRRKRAPRDRPRCTTANSATRPTRATSSRSRSPSTRRSARRPSTSPAPRRSRAPTSTRPSR